MNSYWFCCCFASLLFEITNLYFTLELVSEKQLFTFDWLDLKDVPETEDREGCPRDGWHGRKVQADVPEMES